MELEDSVENVMQKARVCIAPWRCGAGLKGKLLDDMLYVTPGVTTSIGAEEMKRDLLTPGVIADTPEAFAELSVAIYSDKIKWQQNAQRGVEIVKARYNGKAIAKDFMTHLDALKMNLKLHRQSHFVGQILQHHSLQASKYLSKWIEEKNKV